MKVSLNTIEKVKDFVKQVQNIDASVDLVSGRYVIDAKSIMGIFSLDLSKPIDLAIHTEDNLDDVMEVLKPYLNNCMRMPMTDKVRSLNLSNSVAIVLYEALRQNKFDHMKLEGELHRLSW